MIRDIFSRLFKRKSLKGSRDDVKQRLQLVLAHDRSAIDPTTLNKIREEILQVVSKYIELDTESLECYVETNNKMTALTANLPIRRVRRDFDEI